MAVGYGFRNSWHIRLSFLNKLFHRRPCWPYTAKQVVIPRCKNCIISWCFMLYYTQNYVVHQYWKPSLPNCHAHLIPQVWILFACADFFSCSVVCGWILNMFSHKGDEHAFFLCNSICNIHLYEIGWFRYFFYYFTHTLWKPSLWLNKPFCAICSRIQVCLQFWQLFI